MTGQPQYHRQRLRNRCSEVATLASPAHSIALAATVAAEPLLRIFLCGRLANESATAVVREADLPGRQGRLLWAYLVLHRHGPVGRGDLAEAIWGDDSPDAWDPALNVLVSRLRRALAPLDQITIRGEPGRYAVSLPADVWVDWERARDGIHEADRLVRAGQPAAAVAEAGVAMVIAERGFLPGEEAPWIEGQRATLREIRLRACERTVEAELARGRADPAETEARRLLALDPLREASYRLLMRALAAGGNPAQAASVFAACRRTLWERAGTMPSAETEQVFREMVRGHNPPRSRIE